MKHILCILFILSQILLSQGLITDVETHSNGKLNKISFYKESQQGIELVKEKFYYQTGAIKREINYKRNTLHGKCVSYYPNGKRQSERMYQLGEERSVRFYSKGGAPMGPINIMGSWVVSEIANGSTSVEFPDFTRGKWKNNKPIFVVSDI